MSKKKHTHPKKSTQPAKAPAPKAANTQAWVLGAIVVIGVMVAAVVAGGRSNQPAQPNQAGQTGQTSLEVPNPVPADEAAYLGRFLPAGYTAPAVTGATTYSSVAKMSPTEATTDDKGVTISASDVVSKKIVSFEIQKDGKPLSMIAYVRPSGKVFVGVSLCPPCQGRGQRIESDGTLTCESCGTKRDLESDVGISGPCKLFPLDELPVTLEGDTIAIPQAAIDGWTEQPIDRQVGG